MPAYCIFCSSGILNVEYYPQTSRVHWKLCDFLFFVNQTALNSHTKQFLYSRYCSQLPQKCPIYFSPEGSRPFFRCVEKIILLAHSTPGEKNDLRAFWARENLRPNHNTGGKKVIMINVDGSEIRRSPVDMVDILIIYKGFIHPRWLFGISEPSTVINGDLSGFEKETAWNNFMEKW